MLSKSRINAEAFNNCSTRIRFSFSNRLSASLVGLPRLSTCFASWCCSGRGFFFLILLVNFRSSFDPETSLCEFGFLIEGLLGLENPRQCTGVHFTVHRAVKHQKNRRYRLLRIVRSVSIDFDTPSRVRILSRGFSPLDDFKGGFFRNHQSFISSIEYYHAKAGKARTKSNSEYPFNEGWGGGPGGTCPPW